MVIFTGIQPSGALTLGNYLGAIQNFEKINQPGEKSFFCIVDQHAITAKLIEPNVLRANIKSAAATYIAMDLHLQTNIFIQSHVQAHTALAWVMQATAKNGELDRMTQYKDKSRNNISTPTALYTYPVLMAADILLYDTTHIPVGLDQKQHVELTINIAKRFNHNYQTDLFTIPTPVINKETNKIYSLTDPLKKMSKSDENPKSTIFILDDRATVLKKIKSATTDSIGAINFDYDNQPGVTNLITIYCACQNQTVEQAMALFSGQNYGFLKQTVATAISDLLEPFQLKYYAVLEDTELISQVLAAGAKQANLVASKKLQDVYDTIGFI